MLVTAVGARDWSERHSWESPCLVSPRYQHLLGLCDLGMGCPELESVSLSEIAAVRGLLGLPVERDVFFEASKSIGAYAAAVPEEAAA
jgi:hypothetical protein